MRSSLACLTCPPLVYKGSPQLNLEDMSPGKTAAAILLTGLVVCILSVLFWVPYVRAKVIKKDYSKFCLEAAIPDGMNRGLTRLTLQPFDSTTSSTVPCSGIDLLPQTQGRVVRAL
jgi:hypothetical protein